VSEPARLNPSLYPRREAVTLALLTGLAIVLFLAVTGLSHLFEAQQQSLAMRWSTRGNTDLRAQKFGAAVTDFRAALLHARDSYSYQLGLAQALLGLNRTDEAYNYLINLWDRQPENGTVNLELARIAAGRGQTPQALRFYHNAIYATWPGDQETASQNARLELIGYLLGIHAKIQAQAELIALAANLPEDSPVQQQLGQLFLRVQDAQHALSAYQSALKQNKHNEAALAGAGAAAFQLGLYPTARTYLQAALQLSPDDSQSAEWLRKTEFVLEFDPYLPRISIAVRDRAVVNAFTAAGERLKTCTERGQSAAMAAQSLSQQWTKLKPQITASGLRRNPDLVNTAMGLVASIETNTSRACGPMSDSDNALLLIANLHGEN
jgi:tetratricopeptide (TPR) repeat protein